MKSKFLLAALLVASFWSPLSGYPQERPLTKDQVLGLVRSQLGDESGAKLVQQRGIDFEPTEDFIRTLREAGAGEAFLKAVRGVRGPSPAAQTPLDEFQVLDLLANEIPSRRIAMLVEQRGLRFEVSERFLYMLQGVGVEEILLNALKKAKVSPSDAAALRRHAELVEQDYRARLQMHPDSLAARVALDWALDIQGKKDQRVALWREAVSRKPDNASAHDNLGFALGQKGDFDGAIAEYREALRLRPDDALAHNNLGYALYLKRDLGGAMAEYREALRLKPDFAETHNNLGILLDGKGDLDGAIAEYRAALRLKPDHASVHYNLGYALYQKRDLEGAMAEYREALRLKPDHAGAHNDLGAVLEKKGDRQGALNEYRAAYKLEPNNPNIRDNYERLAREVKK